ncbi:UNVERIFIED_ORG: hypothetical protein Xoosp15_150 [Xanthomonas phage Xoo-sp15]
MSTINMRDNVMQILNRAHSDAKREIYKDLSKVMTDQEKIQIENDHLRAENESLKARVKFLESLPTAMPKSLVETVEPKKILKDAVTDEDLFVDGKMDEDEKYLYFNETSDRLYTELGLEKQEGTVEPGHKPVLLIAKDCSGSMGIWEKYMSRCIATWTINMLNRKYGQHVEVRYVNFHTEAKEVSESVFHKGGESGGTIASSATKLLNTLTDEYNYESTDNVHVLILSDGDNLTSDNARFIKFLSRVAGKAKEVWYVEPNQYNRHSTIRTAFDNFKSDKKIGVHSLMFKTRGQVLPLLYKMFNRDAVADNE